ncbi:hypothetical protein [Shewanella sp. YLB-07]|uniref:hypothetical protein n=1 Tax=Shewanella sp. YLB-07 TaxID=2601268 RepID=UPI00128BFA60|nr:hypothetical protein [Shewanella sp. YLB-07]MPY23755.1 hypothetical protein [Shewanella sp. YLB-07]
MARNKVIQVACAPELYSNVVDYKKSKNLTSDAEAMRELTLFALRLLAHSDNDDGLSTRELMETILIYVVKNQYTSSLVHYQTFNEGGVDLNKASAKHKEVIEKAEYKISQILNGDK